MPKKLFKSHGKLLLFGEYAVIDGAKSLAIPCKKGQSLEIKPHRGSDLIWECYDHNDELWFEAQIYLIAKKIIPKQTFKASYNFGKKMTFCEDVAFCNIFTLNKCFITKYYQYHF